VAPSKTPTRSIPQVVIYTPSKTWVPVDTAHAEAQGLVSRVNQDPFIDSDSENELDRIEETQISTHRALSTLSHDTHESIEQASPQTPSRKRRSSIANSPQFEKRPSTPIRDAKGRFSSTGKPNPAWESEYIPPRARPRAHSMSSANKLHCFVRDSSGRFVPTDSVKASSEPPTPTLPQTRSSAARDEKGRFTKQMSLPKDQAPREPVDEVVPATSQEHGCTEIEDSESEAPQLIDVSEAQSLEPIQIPKAKAKRPPTKSPYFLLPPVTPSKRKALKVKSEALAESSPKKEDDEDSTTSSPQSSPKKRSIGLVSCIPFPPLASPTFGLIQEKLASDPFRLLIAVTFLNRTHAKHAIPVYYALMEAYPTPESLAEANKEDIVDIIRHLGFQNQRAEKYQSYAKKWLSDPPEKGKRYAIKGYPAKDSGRDIKKDEIVTDADEREAWEIGHITSGRYALDSWRIFCRDMLRGLATGWNGEDSKEENFQPEWMRVLPEDKELRAYLRWMWLKEGFEWDPRTGEKDVAGVGLMRAAIEGRIAWDDEGGMSVLDEGIGEVSEELKLE